MTLESIKYFMFGLKNYHWKRNPELYKHVEYVLDNVFENTDNIESDAEVYDTIVSSPNGTFVISIDSMKPNTKYDIYIMESKDL